jgi:DnaJ-class molecular chaperone
VKNEEARAENQGSGPNFAQHTQLAKCPTCGGQGWYIDAAIGNDGEPVPIQQQCQHCGGSGIQQASA